MRESPRNRSLDSLQRLIEAFESRPSSAAAASALGTALMRRREQRQAIDCFRAAIDLEPTASHYCQLGKALMASADAREAIRCLEQAVRLEPDHLESTRTLALWYARRPETAPFGRELFLRSIETFPGQPVPVYGLCLAFVIEGGDVEGLFHGVSGVLPSSDPGSIRLGLARALMAVGRYEDGLRCLSAIGAAQATTAAVLAATADAEIALGNTDRAKDAFARGGRDGAGNRRFMEQYLRFLFRTGDRQRARELYQRMARHGTGEPGEDDPVDADFPRWDGSDVSGATIVMKLPDSFAFGDTIQFGRFGARMTALGARVFVECGQPVRDLIATMNVEQAVVPHDGPVPADFYCTPLAAALLLEWDWPLADDLPFLRVPAERIESWRCRLVATPGLHVGLAWQQRYTFGKSNPYTSRTIPLEALRPLMDVPGVTFYSLQVGLDAEAELRSVALPVPVQPWSQGLTTFLDTAAATAALDLVVSIDTAQVHVAGGVGTPCLLMLPFCRDWRWTADREYCGWYRDCRLFGQTSPGRWDDVIDRVRTEVERRALVSLAAADV